MRIELATAAMFRALLLTRQQPLRELLLLSLVFSARHGTRDRGGVETAPRNGGHRFGSRAGDRTSLLRFEVEDVTTAVLLPQMMDNFDRIQTTLGNQVEGPGENDLGDSALTDRSQGVLHHSFPTGSLRFTPRERNTRGWLRLGAPPRWIYGNIPLHRLELLANLPRMGQQAGQSRLCSFALVVDEHAHGQEWDLAGNAR